MSPTAARRKPSGTPPMGWRQWVILTPVAAHLVFLPWALGTMHVWSQWVSFSLAMTGLLAGVLFNPTKPSGSKTPAWKKLGFSPFFWICLAFLGYIAIQALNPSHKYVAIGNLFWLVPIDHISWLPAGLETPFERMNPFRHLIYFSAAAATFLTIALIPERGKALRLLAIILVLNGMALAVVGFAQLFTGAEKILWKFPSSNPTFYTTFIYRNHAAGYLNLVFALSLGLYFYYRERSWKISSRSADISPLFFFTSLVLFTLILFSNSRTGIVFAVSLLLTATVFSIGQAWHWARLRETAMLSAIYVGMFSLFCGVFVAIIGKERITHRFEILWADETELAWQVRWQGSQATWDMFQESRVFGRGAGSFMYVFPNYQKNYPDIQTRRLGRRDIPIVWEFAHNDWAQYPAEYGLVGVGIFVFGALVWLFMWARGGGLRHPASLWIVIGVIAVLTHAFVDFVLQNPAVIITFAAMAGIALRLLSMERPHLSGERHSRYSPRAAPEVNAENQIG